MVLCQEFTVRVKLVCEFLHEENFMAIFITLSVAISFPTGTLGIFATHLYVFTMRVVIYDILSMHGEIFMAIFTTLSVVLT